MSDVLEFCDYAKTEWLHLVSNLNDEMVAEILSLYKVTEPKMRREEESQKHSHWYSYKDSYCFIFFGEIKSLQEQFFASRFLPCDVCACQIMSLVPLNRLI